MTRGLFEEYITRFIGPTLITFTVGLFIGSFFLGSLFEPREVTCYSAQGVPQTYKARVGFDCCGISYIDTTRNQCCFEGSELDPENCVLPLNVNCTVCNLDQPTQ
ncbi:MAG: hypothetical protein ABJM06_09525 [Gilvibacter sp.]